MHGRTSPHTLSHGLFCETRYNGKRLDRAILTAIFRDNHLKSEFSGNLKAGVTDIDLINSLHPTPAVGGDPWEVVSELISSYEPFHRGWYAGLVGYIGEDSADFSVALRSGLIYNNTLSLYAGVGVVDGSKPDKEWEEGNWKIKNYEEIFA